MATVKAYLDLLSQQPEGAPQELIDSIVGVESSGNPNAVSPQGARGRAQVMPATFKQYGDGTPFEQATDEQLYRAAVAKLNDDYRHYGGDIEKTTAAYIGGRGAVLPDGTIRDDVADAHGTTPLAYSQRVISRMGTSEPVQVAQSGDPDEFLNYLKSGITRPEAVAEPDDTSITEDVGRLLKSGANQAAQDVRELVGRIPFVGKPIQGAIDKVDEYVAGKSSEALLKDDTKAMLEGLSPETKEAMGKKWWDEEKGTFGDAWKDPRAYMAGVVQSLPETALMMFPSMRLAKGTYTAATLAGMTAKEAAKRAARVATLTGSITEGLLGGAQTSIEVRDEIMAMPDEQLAQSDAVKALMADGMSLQEARKSIAEDAATRGFLVAGVADGVFGGAGDRMLAGALTKGIKGGLITRVLKGMVAEGVLEELPQSYLEQVGRNLGMQMVDPAVETTEGALNQALGGMATGAIMGGGMAAPFSERADQPEAAPAPGADPEMDPAKRSRVEQIVRQMQTLRQEAGVDQNNGDIYATPLGEQYQWLESKLNQELTVAPPVADIAGDKPEPVQAAPEPDIPEPMPQFAERAMVAYSTQERAQTVAESMSKVQNGQYVVTAHPRMPNKFAVVPTEWVNLPARTPLKLTPEQDEISRRLEEAASQAPQPLTFKQQMQQAAVDRAERAIVERQGVASPAEAQILEEAGVPFPFDRVDPALAQKEQQTTPRERIQFGQEAEQRAEAADQLDQFVRGTPNPKVAQDDVALASQRIEEAARQAEPPRMDRAQVRIMDAVEEGRATAAPQGVIPQVAAPQENVTPSGIVLPEGVKPLPPPMIGKKSVKDLSLGELKTYAKSEKPDIAAKAKAEISFRAVMKKSAPGLAAATIANSPEAPMTSNVPFGASYQLHRLARVTRNTASREDVAVRSDLGPFISRYPQVFTKLSPMMRGEINDAVTDLQAMGMPESWLWGVRNIGTHNDVFGPTVRGRFNSHVNSTGEPVRAITLMRSMLERYDSDAAVPYQMRGVLAHEVGHSVEFVNDEGYLSHKSPLFDAELSETGELVPVGPIMQEAMRAYVEDIATKGPLADVLNYPFADYRQAGANHEGMIDFYKSETFAQLSSLYLLNPALMQERLPSAFELFEEIKHATESLGSDSAGAPRGDVEATGREGRLAAAVQGAFRAVSERAGLQASRGQRVVETGRTVGSDRQGRPGADGAAESTSLVGRSGREQLTGSNQGFKADEQGHRRAKNVNDITDEEFEAEIKKVGDRIAGLKTGSIAEVRAIAKRLEQAAKRGIAGRDWYERSAYAILTAFHGNTYLAEKFIQAIAITSPNTAVKQNFAAAAKAWEQFAQGEKIHVQTADADQKLTDLFYFGKDWEGRKTNTFYLNLTEAMLGNDSGFSTQDMHMGNLAFGKGKITDAQYELLENLTRRVAGTKQMNMSPRQLQASAWVTQKAKHLFDYYRERGWKKDLSDKDLRAYVAEEALVNYADIAATKRWAPTINDRVMTPNEQIQATIQNITMETQPSPTTDDFKRIENLPLKERRKFSEAILRAVPLERIGALFGLDSRTMRYGGSTGGYSGNLAPNFIVQIAPETIGQQMTQEEWDRVNNLALAMMYVYRQDAVPFFRADPGLVGTAQFGLQMTFASELTETKEQKMFARLREAMGEDAGYTKVAPNRIVLINFRGEDGTPFMMPDVDFAQAADRFADSMQSDNPVTERQNFGAKSEYPYHDWNEDPAGDSILARIQGGAAGRPNLQERLRAWRSEAEAASTAWIEERGLADIAGSSEEAGIAGRVGRGDVPPVRGSTPRVSIRPRRADAQEVVGIHYSHVAGLAALDGNRYGTGIKGAEADRLSWEPSLKPRAYFYLQSDLNVLPRPEPGLGREVHRAVLTNMYPFATDPAGIFPKIRNLFDPGEKANTMERLIIEAGYDGYINKQLGMAVILGNAPVDVEHIGRYDPNAQGLDVAGSDFVATPDTSDETLTSIVQSQLSMAGIDGDTNLFPLGHARRVALYATELGRATGMSEKEIAMLSTAAMLHDIGKVTLPEPILNKAGKLTDDERAVIQSHTTAAERLLRGQAETIKSAATQHHENWDGTGYPNGLAGEQISKFARILAVADVFDALTASDRPYKKAWTAEEAFKQLREWSGTHFEPGLVEKFEGVAEIAGSNSEAPLWYSELAKSVEGIKQQTAPAGQWIAMIDNLTTKGIKGDEIEWSGVREWLRLQEGKVRKDQIIGYLNQNGIQIEETLKSENSQRAAIFDEYRGPLQEQLEIIANYDLDESERDAAKEEYDRLFEEREQRAKEAPDDEPKFRQYSLPGGEHYRELLLTLPQTVEHGWRTPNGAFFTEAELKDPVVRKTAEKVGLASATRTVGPEFRSGHYDERNILAHVRFNERTDAEGKRVLFIEEIQSDWGQQGKKKGFGFSEQETKRYADLQARADNLTEQEEAEWRAFNRRATNPVPSAPFVGKTGQWVSLAMKRMIRWAADNGFDRIAWTTGEQQAARYDLSKQVEAIAVTPAGGQYEVIAYKNSDGDEALRRNVSSREEVADLIGKEAADRAFEKLDKGSFSARLTGPDLRVGGSGMKAFYDQIVPKAANELLRKLGGGKVGRVPVMLEEPVTYEMVTAAEEAGNWDEAARLTEIMERQELGRGTSAAGTSAPSGQPGFDITPKLRETALKGMPLFAGSNSATVMPDWLANMPAADQEAARKAGIVVPKLTYQDRLQRLRKGWKERVTQGLFDQYAPVKALDERAYVLSRMTKAGDGTLEGMLMYGKPVLNSAGALDVADLDKGGVIQLMAELGGEHDRFLGWIAGQRAHLLKQQGRENLFTDTDITALRNWNQGQMADGRDRAKLYADVHRRFQAFNAAVLDVAEKAGLVDAAERKTWEQDFYVPFYRVLEDENYQGPRDAGGLVNQYAFKRLRGGKEQLHDLFENTIRNWGHLLSASLKNQAAEASIKAAEQAGVAFETQGREKGAVSFRDHGKQRWFMIEEPLLLDAITSLEYAGISGGPVMKAFQKAKHYLTFGVTMAPAFKIRNLIRDQVSAVALNPISGNIVGNLAQGWNLTAKDSAQYAHMLAGGGLMRFGTSLEGNRAKHIDRLVKMSGNAPITTTEQARNVLEKMWDAWQELGDRSENITRAAVYRQAYDKAIKAGKSADEAHLIASYQARDSMDFSLQGSYSAVRLLSQLVPFLNARLQGLYSIGRKGASPTIRLLTGKAKPGDAAAALRFNSMAFAVSAASVLLMLANRDDDDWKAREDWDRDTYWWFKVGGTAYRIPKPFELGAIGTLAERGVEAMMNGLGEDDRKLFVQRLGWLLANTFSFNPVPQLVKPVVDLYANTDSFTGRPIESAGMERLSKPERIGVGTSALAQVLGKAGNVTGLSPVQIDSLIDGYFSWLGSNVLWLSDFVMRPAMGLPEKPTWRMEDYPVLGSFARELPAPQSRYVSLFYENANRFGQLAADIQHYQQLGLTEKAMELYEERKDGVALSKMYSRVQQQMAAINRQVRIVQASNLSADEKRDRIDVLNEGRNRLAKLVEERRKSMSKS